MTISIGSREAPGGVIHLDGGELLLLHQILNEAVNGIQLNHFYSRVGITRDHALQILRQLHLLLDRIPHDTLGIPTGNFELGFSTQDGRALRNCTELVIEDLGREEFSTRTGFDFEAGIHLLDTLHNALLSFLEAQRDLLVHEAKV